MVEGDKSSIGDAYSQAVHAAELSDADVAEREIRRIWEESHGDTGVARVLVGHLYDSGRHDEARALLERELALAPESLHLRRVSARIHLAEREYPQARLIAQQLLLEEPEDVEARIVLGQSLLRQGHPRDAVETLRSAVESGALPVAGIRLYRVARLRQHDLAWTLAFVVVMFLSYYLNLFGYPVASGIMLGLASVPVAVAAAWVYGRRGVLLWLIWCFMSVLYYALVVLLRAAGLTSASS